MNACFVEKAIYISIYIPVIIVYTVDILIQVYGKRDTIQTHATLSASEAAGMEGSAQCLQYLSQKCKVYTTPKLPPPHKAATSS